MSLSDALVGLAKSVASRGRMERLIRQNGWAIDERRNDTLGLHFKCPIEGTKTVYTTADDDALVMFLVYSGSTFNTRNVPDEVMAAALYHNSKSIPGKWEVSLNGENLRFLLTYTALSAGLDAAAIKYICESMAKQASAFDSYMQEKGYL